MKFPPKENFPLFHYDGNASPVIEEAILLLICMLSSFSFLRVECRFHWYTDPHRQIPQFSSDIIQRTLSLSWEPELVTIQSSFNMYP